jgi:hypothetical protein
VGKISSPVQSQLQVELDSAMFDLLNGFIMADLPADNQPTETGGDMF